MKKHIIGVIGALILMGALGYFRYNDEMKSIEQVCPLLIAEGGDCDCFVPAFKGNYGTVSGILEASPVIGRLFPLFVDDERKTSDAMVAAAAQCDTVLENYSEGNSCLLYTSPSPRD